MAACRRATVFGPASRIRSPALMASSSRTLAGAPDSSRSATTTSNGRSSSHPAALADAMISRAVSARSFSQNEAATFTPFANRKVLAMPPPIARASSFRVKLFRRSSLVETLEPPTTPRTGWTGEPSAASRASNSRRMASPAKAGSRCASPSVEACARCAVENASFT